MATGYNTSAMEYDTIPFWLRYKVTEYNITFIVTGANMAATLFAALVGFIFFTNIYPALDKSNCSPGSLTYPENTGSLFQSRLESLLHFIARVRFASSSQRRIRRAIVAWKTRGLTFLPLQKKAYS